MPLRLGLLPEVPCADCGTRVEGLRWGDRCRDCQRARKRRAARIGTRVGLVLTLGCAAWLTLRLPTTPTARGYGAIALLVVFLIGRQVGARAAMELMK